MFRIAVFILVSLYILTGLGPLSLHADELLLPPPGTMLPLTKPYNAPVLRGLKMDGRQPFRFDFIVDKGDASLGDAQLNAEANRLIKYFLASLTIPSQDLWVNLSPYEKDRIVPDAFGRTEMGRDLLALDYILKQLTASLIYPDTESGREFWKDVYLHVKEKYGTTGIPANTFNKVWIMPEKAVVYENAKAGTAYIVESRLKVMLEKDYTSSARHVHLSRVEKRSNPSAVSAQIVRDSIIPALTKEVNTGRNFARLRQIYNSIILAAWYKRKIKESILNQLYVDKSKVAGVDIADATEKERIYQRYLEAFKKGVFNYIREERDPLTHAVMPRKYFSGGVTLNVEGSQGGSHLGVKDSGMIVTDQVPPIDKPDNYVLVRENTVVADPAQSSSTRRSVLAALSGTGVVLFDPRILLSQTASSLDSVQVKAILRFFSDNAHAVTGFSNSNFGDDAPVSKYGASTYDLSLRAIAQAGTDGLKIVNAFSRNITQAAGEESPSTLNANYEPAGGVFSNIRIKNFSEPNWWNSWEFRISAGDNAWIGLAALHNYAKTRSSRLLTFAKERAAFLKKLQDKDGALRYGPKGQYHPSGDPDFYWKVKSTENNESALYFFDMLYQVTKDAQYRETADQIYAWLLGKMYDPNSHTFSRGAVYANGRWTKDDVKFFAADTTTWAPLERILPVDRLLQDDRIGTSRLQRLEEFEKMIQATEALAGVYVGNVLKGVSFSPQSKARGVISVEWTSQLALRYWRVAQEYAFVRKQTADAEEKSHAEKKEKEYIQKYDALMAVLGSYFKNQNGALVAPYAVFTDGSIAASMPTGHGWDTPHAFAAAASIYYAFAVAKFDPFILDQAMLGGESTAQDDLVRTVRRYGLHEIEAFVPDADAGEPGSTVIELTSGPEAMRMTVKYPRHYIYKGQKNSLSADFIRKTIVQAISELQSEHQDFRVRGIDQIEVVDDINRLHAQRPKGVIYVPLQTLVSTLEEGDGNFSDAFRNEMIKFFVHHQATASETSGDLKYMVGLEPKISLPSYDRVPPADYHIVVPIYNEADNLEGILGRIKALGYLKKITFVNDASTDNTKEIMDRWREREGLEVLHLTQNKKKEGAIRDALEMLERQGRLSDKIILLDADSFLTTREEGRSLEQMVARASLYMEEKNIAGMAFRMDPLLPRNANVLQKAQYAEYSSVRFWNKISSQRGKLWVINGPGGIFRGKTLLHTLRHMVPDFETGDLLITVRMMKEGHRVGYYPDIVVQTTVPKTVKELFKQRRRWERGTAKVLVNEAGFYVNQFRKPNILALQTGLTLSFPVMVAAGIVMVPFSSWQSSLSTFVESYFLWIAINAGLSLTDPYAKQEGDRERLLKWLFIQGLVYMGIVAPARLAGLYDAAKYFISQYAGDLKTKSDKAMVEAPGGIDLNADQALAVHAKGEELVFQVDKATLENLKGALGFKPVILSIQPISDIHGLLGVTTQQAASISAAVPARISAR